MPLIDPRILRRQSVATLHSKGWGVNRIAEFLGASSRTIGDDHKAIGLKPNKDPRLNGQARVAAARREKIGRLMGDIRLSPWQIASKLHIAHSLVIRDMRRIRKEQKNALLRETQSNGDL